MTRPIRVMLAVCAALLACEPSETEVEAPPPGPTALVDHTLFEPVSLEQDPLSSDAPAEIRCPSRAYAVESELLEIRTGDCNYISLGQPSAVAVSEGDTLSLVLWHLGLANEAAAEAHVGVSLDGRVLWETRVPIPSAPELWDVEWRAEFSAPAGAPVVLHLHNHGINSWRFKSLTVTPGPG